MVVAALMVDTQHPVPLSAPFAELSEIAHILAAVHQSVSLGCS